MSIHSQHFLIHHNTNTIFVNLSFGSIANITSRNMSTIFFYQLLLCAVIVALYLSMMASSNLFSFNIIVCLAAMSTVLLPTFFYCKLSESVTFDLELIGDTFYECSWYYLHPKQQQMFVLPIQRAQNCFRMTGLGIVECSLNAFSFVSLYYDFHCIFHWLIHINVFLMRNLFLYVRIDCQKCFFISGADL